MYFVHLLKKMTEKGAVRRALSLPNFGKRRPQASLDKAGSTVLTDGKVSHTPHPSWPLPLRNGIRVIRGVMGLLNRSTVDEQLFQRVRAIERVLGATSPTGRGTQIDKVYILRRQDIVLSSDGMTAEEAKGSIKAEWVSFRDAASEEPRNEDSVILYLHGGAYCMASRKTHRGITWKLAKYANCRVLSVDYRLAPEHVFPLAIQDALSAYSFLVNPPAGAKKYAPEKVVFMGDSAGGGLCLATILWLRDHGMEHGLPMPGGAALLSPWLDLSHSMDSFRTNARYDILPDKVKDRILTENRNHYYIKDNSFLKNPLVSPLFSTESELTPLPPMCIHIGELERLRDENLAFYIHVFKNSRIQMELYESQIHVFQLFNTIYPFADESLKRYGEFVKRVTSTNFQPDQFERSIVKISHADGYPTSPLTIDAVEALLGGQRKPEESVVLKGLMMKEPEADKKSGFQIG
ncbi:Alpha/Beta hydrolase protein [Chytriomyces sp. MP71]|nr:Alpha/Beta hydrolase protein [Chytriomyces sp. MP71]